jgi:transglutaminase-like putative cysteine protease
MIRAVQSTVRYAVTDDTRFALAVATAGVEILEEEIAVGVAEGPITLSEVHAPHGTRIHCFTAPVGEVVVRYRSRVGGSPIRPSTPDAFEALLYARPSRYCPSDHLGGFAIGEFGLDRSPLDRVRAIVDWIVARVGYMAGVGTVHDSAEHTLLTGAGTCRDFAHLGVALARALDIPARFTSVYAPGLSPMDFHAVFEALIDDRWLVFDATRLAPRTSMVRIATGRDAADTPFATVLEGSAELVDITVGAIVEGQLPTDNPDDLVELA